MHGKRKYQLNQYYSLDNRFVELDLHKRSIRRFKDEIKSMKSGILSCVYFRVVNMK